MPPFWTCISIVFLKDNIKSKTVDNTTHKSVFEKPKTLKNRLYIVFVLLLKMPEAPKILLAGGFIQSF
jgi:hypothetical protein